MSVAYRHAPASIGSSGDAAAVRAFAAAVLKADAAAVRWLVERGARVDAVLPSGLTPLMIAVGKNAGEIVHLLVAAGADVNAPQGDPPIVPLAWACLAGSSRDTVRTLLELGARVDRAVVEMARAVAHAGLKNAHLDLAVANRHAGVLGAIVARGDVAGLALARLGVPAGAPLLAVARYSAAERAGLRRDDAIVAIDGTVIDDAESAAGALAGRYAGDALRVTIVRNGCTIDAAVELQPRLPNGVPCI
jgi:ankyrin repeat protein